MVSVDGTIGREYINALLKEMWCQDDHKSTLNSALESAEISTPILSKIAVAVNTCLGGSLGTRSTRKQLQALLHHAYGNLEMRVSKNVKIPCTYLLPICAFVGQGKSNYYNFMKDLVNLLADGTATLDREIYTAKKAAVEPDNINHILSLKSNPDAEKGFVQRQQLHNPGTKEA